MSSTTTDRRVRRTRDLLHRALVSLILEKGYNRITVQDILDRADIGRSTFYAHYRDKDDLFTSGFEELRSALVAETAPAGDPGAAGGEAEAEFLQPVLAVFRHVDGYRHLYKALAGKGGADLAVHALREFVSGLVREDLRSQPGGSGSDQTRLEAALEFVVSALMGLLIWWLENDVPYTPDELHAVFRGLATQDVRRFLAT